MDISMLVKQLIEELQKNSYFLHLIPEIERWLHDYFVNSADSRETILRNHLLSLKQAPYFLNV